MKAVLKGVAIAASVALGVVSATLSSAVFASPLAGLQECQSIKNSAKRAECFDKQTQIMVREENEKKQREEIERAEAERAKIEAEKLAAAEAEKLKVISSAKEVIRSLRKFENRIETGISYRDYPSIFSEARFDVKSFSDSILASKIPEFNAHCLKAIENYSDAQAVWRQKITDSNRYSGDVIYTDWNLVDMVTSKYPATSAARNGRSMRASYAMQVIWAEASANIRKAEDALRKWEQTKD